MIDIHCHLLFDVDDGSKSIEESIKAIIQMKELGYTDIILTPHYIQDSNYNSNKKSNQKKLEILKKELKNNNIDINLYLGNEIYIDDDILEMLNAKEISSLNNTDYLLVELPMSGDYDCYIDLFSYLINNDKKIILAHPERYISFQNDWNKIIELEEIGVLFQSNLESIIGNYGRNAKKLIKKLLKEKKITFLATDLHHPKKDYMDIMRARKKILKYIMEDEFNKLVVLNPKKVIENKDI